MLACERLGGVMSVWVQYGDQAPIAATVTAEEAGKRYPIVTIVDDPNGVYHSRESLCVLASVMGPRR